VPGSEECRMAKPSKGTINVDLEREAVAMMARE
jgi:hypothetical protein